MSEDKSGPEKETTTGHNDDPSVDIQTIRDRLINKGLVYFAFFIPLPLTISLSRIVEHGWHPIYLLHIGMTIAIITGALLRKRLPYRIRAFLVTGIWLVLGTAGLYVFGLAGGPPLLLTIFAIMMAIAFGTRGGLIACFIDVVVIAALGTAIESGIITPSYGTYQFAISLTSWLLVSTSFIVFVPIPIIALGVVQSHLKDSFEKALKREAQHRAILEAMPDMIFRLSRDGTYLDF